MLVLVNLRPIYIYALRRTQCMVFKKKNCTGRECVRVFIGTSVRLYI
jgi:hypothetical protein